MDYYTDFLRLCEFQPDEIEKEKPRIERAFEAMQIGPADIQRAEKRVRDNFDIELLGVRQILGLCIIGLIDLALARQEHSKVVYKNWCLHSQLGFALMRSSEDVYVGTPEIIGTIMGQIFDKFTPVIEAGEARGLSAGKAHCAGTQTYLGAMDKGMVPIPDFMINSGYYCDQAAEAGELKGKLFNVTQFHVDGVVDSNWDAYPQFNKRMIAYTGGQIEKAIKKFEEITGYKVTEEMKKEGRRDNGRYWRNLQKLVELVAKSDPQAISQADVNLAFWLYAVPIRDRERVNGAVTTLIGEVEKRIEEGKGVVKKGAPKVYFALQCGVDPTLVKVVEELGISISVCHWNWVPPDEWEPRTGKSFGEKLAEGNCARSYLQSSFGVADFHKKCCEHFKVDGIIQIYPQSCRPWCIAALMARKFIKDKLDIPIIILEGDVFDSRSYTAQQLRTRIETFAQMLKARKAIAA